MQIPTLGNNRFDTEKGLHIIVQVPKPHVQQIIDAVLAETSLQYGDYDSVSFTSETGAQQFRSLGSGRNVATDSVVTVACVELSFFVEEDDCKTIRIIKSIYSAHPYEEPVVFVRPCLRTLHKRGLDENNPNRFWNRATEDWVPESHR